MRDLKFVFGLLALCLFLLWLFTSPASAANSTGTGIPYYVQQGDTVYINQTIDISGVSAGVLNLAYYGGFDCYGDNQYLLDMPELKVGYYNFYLDPEIFGNRIGKWCKWNGYVESNGNLLAFVVRPQQSNVHLINQTLNETENASLQNPNQTPMIIPRIPFLPVQHVSDYLIARGNGFSIPLENGTTNLWIFGAREGIYDYHHIVNNSIDITEDVINKLSPGTYRLLLQTRATGAIGSSTIRFNQDNRMLEWFDPVQFAINRYDTNGQSPEHIYQKLIEVFPATGDTYRIFNLEVQEPTISINQVDALNVLNGTGFSQNEGVNLESPSYIEVRGYTNVAPDTLIQVLVDPDFNIPESVLWRDAISTAAVGEVGGDMREFKVIIPVKLYDMAPNRHFVGARTTVGNAITTADFYIYGNPTGGYIPNKTIRYISGRYGPEEMVQTPTPIIQTVTVTVPVPGPVITVPVTPSNEQVRTQQKIIADENNWFWATRITAGGIVVFIVWYAISLYLRRKECPPINPNQ